jgi:fatty-acyl-CoA synthase
VGSSSRASQDVCVLDPGGAEICATWRSLDHAARRLATELARRDLGPGDVVVVPGATSWRTLVAVVATWRCGAVPTLVPVRQRSSLVPHPDDVEQRHALLPGQLGTTTYLLDLEAPGPRELPAGVRPITVDAALWEAPAPEDRRGAPAADALAWPPPGLSDTDVAFYQATSGTTGSSRLVAITWRMLLRNLESIARRLELTSEDSLVSWLPLYHDMGFVGFFLLPAFLGARLSLLPPETFARAPSLLARTIERRAGTMTGSPTYGLALLELALRRRGELDLSTLRHLVCGADMIDLEICDRLLATGRRHGLGPTVLGFAYGMAEATLAVSIRTRSTPEQAESQLPVAGTDQGPGLLHHPHGRGLAKTGRPLDGVEIRVVSARTGLESGPGEIGEIQVRGTSVIAGYVGATSPAATSVSRAAAGAGAGADGLTWWATGDLGYLAGGELVVVGRDKDVIKVRGEGLLPDDVERVVGRMPGLRRDMVVAVPVRDLNGEGLGIIAAQRAGGATTERDVRVEVRRALGVTPSVVTFVPKGAIPRTTSGKVRRSASRELLTPVGDGRVAAGSEGILR